MMTGLSTLSKRLANVVARAVVTATDSALKCQAVGLRLIAGESRENVEQLEPYGFTATAHPGAEAVVLFPAGDRSQGVVINVADRRYRLKGLAEGEVALYSDEGDSVVLRRGRLVEVNTAQLIINASSRITLNTPLIEASGEYQGRGNVADGRGTMQALRATYNAHTHAENGDGGGTTNKPNQPMS